MITNRVRTALVCMAMALFVSVTGCSKSDDESRGTAPPAASKRVPVASGGIERSRGVDEIVRHDAAANEPGVSPPPQAPEVVAPAVTPPPAAIRPEPKPQPSPVKKAPPPEIPQYLKAADIAALVKRLTHHERVLWDNSTHSHNLYVGGILMARYFNDQKLLTVNTDNRDTGNLVCMYDMEGRLKFDVPRGLKVPAPVRACYELAKTLEQIVAGK